MPRLPELLALDEEQFGLRFTVSAVKRAKRRGLLRNVAVALGNTRQSRRGGAARALDRIRDPSR